MGWNAELPLPGTQYAECRRRALYYLATVAGATIEYEQPQQTRGIQKDIRPASLVQCVQLRQRTSYAKGGMRE